MFESGIYVYGFPLRYYFCNVEFPPSFITLLSSQLLFWPSGRDACPEWDTSCLAEGEPPVTRRALLICVLCNFHFHFAYFIIHQKVICDVVLVFGNRNLEGGGPFPGTIL